MSVPFEVTVDKANFPIVRVPALGFDIYWLPITKIQFEHFMCDTGLYDNNWYQDKLRQYNDRVSPGSINLGNYWGVFMTGILPAEALRFASWCGRGFDLPTAQEWKKTIQYFANISAGEEFIDAVTSALGISERAKLLVERLEHVTSSDSQQLGGGGRLLCDQMLLRLGIMEYIYEDEQHNTFGGWGKPNRRFWGSMLDPLRDAGYVRLGKRTEGVRMKQYGFRLIRRI
jgi:hypothetical protein